MSQQKPKKTFLKKGTRQFLSNATVRSLSQKPKIVQFDEDNFQSSSSPFINSGNMKNQQKEQILINVKPKNFSKDKAQSNMSSKQNIKKNNNLIENKKPFKNEISQQKNIQTFERPIQSASLSKNTVKKPTLLSDYLNNENKPLKKPPQANPSPVTLPKSNIPKVSPPSNVQSQAHQLRMQNIEDDSDEDQENEENEFTNDFFNRNKKPSPSPQQSKRIQPIKKKPNLLQEVMKVKNQKQNFNIENQKVEQNEVKFDSDSDNEEEQKSNKFKSKSNKNTHNNRFKQPQLQESDQQAEQQNEQINRKATVKLSTKPQSKVTQMFNKNLKTSGQGMNQNQIVEPIKEKKMTIDDVPKQLIEQIVEKYFKDAKSKYEKKQQNLFEQVKIVQKKQQAMAQQQKAMQKRLKEFQRQLQQKNKQFESKIKSQQNKITRQKMYLKDQQTGNKLDWKTKNIMQELKQQLQDQRNERKRIEVKLKGQLDRLKARFTQQMQIKKNLQNRIKQYELREIKQKQIKVKQERQFKQEMIQKKKTFWDDAPKQSYLEKFFNKDFTLCQYLVQDYFYQHNEFYQYYKEKGDSDTLQVQQVEGNKIKRTYENGKVEIQSIQKFVKEVFPWGFTIVHYINGDVKQVIQLPNKNDPSNPKKLEIYYAKNNQIIEYSISDGKRIHYFLGEDQIQLNDEVLEMKEIFNGKQLQRVIQGNSVMLQKNAKGNFVQLY